MVLGGGGIALPSILNLFLLKPEPKHNLKILHTANSHKLNLFSLAYSEIVYLFTQIISQLSEQVSYFQDDGVGDKSSLS